MDTAWCQTYIFFPVFLRSSPDASGITMLSRVWALHKEKRTKVAEVDQASTCALTALDHGFALFIQSHLEVSLLPLCCCRWPSSFSLLWWRVQSLCPISTDKHLAFQPCLWQSLTLLFPLPLKGLYYRFFLWWSPAWQHSLLPLTPERCQVWGWS